MQKKTQTHSKIPSKQKAKQNRWLKTQRTVTHNLQSVKKWNGTLQKLMYNKVKKKKHFLKRNYKNKKKKLLDKEANVNEKVSWLIISKLYFYRKKSKKNRKNKNSQKKAKKK